MRRPQEEQALLASLQKIDRAILQRGLASVAHAAPPNPTLSPSPVPAAKPRGASPAPAKAAAAPGGAQAVGAARGGARGGGAAAGAAGGRAGAARRGARTAEELAASTQSLALRESIEKLDERLQALKTRIAGERRSASQPFRPAFHARNINSKAAKCAWWRVLRGCAGRAEEVGVLPSPLSQHAQHAQQHAAWGGAPAHAHAAGPHAGLPRQPSGLLRQNSGPSSVHPRSTGPTETPVKNIKTPTPNRAKLLRDQRQAQILAQGGYSTAAAGANASSNALASLKGRQASAGARVGGEGWGMPGSSAAAMQAGAPAGMPPLPRQVSAPVQPSLQQQQQQQALLQQQMQQAYVVPPQQQPRIEAWGAQPPQQPQQQFASTAGSHLNVTFGGVVPQQQAQQAQQHGALMAWGSGPTLLPGGTLYSFHGGPGGGGGPPAQPPPGFGMQQQAAQVASPAFAFPQQPQLPFNAPPPPQQQQTHYQQVMHAPPHAYQQQGGSVVAAQGGWAVLPQHTQQHPQYQQQQQQQQQPSLPPFNAPVQATHLGVGAAPWGPMGAYPVAQQQQQQHPGQQHHALGSAPLPAYHSSLMRSRTPSNSSGTMGLPSVGAPAAGSPCVTSCR